MALRCERASWELNSKVLLKLLDMVLDKAICCGDLH
jgi:hypothetical protein